MIELTNGVQISEDRLLRTATASVDSLSSTGKLEVMQYDDKMPVAAVTLTRKAVTWTPPEVAALRVRMGKPDGHGVLNDALGMDADGTVYFAFTRQMTAAHGVGEVSIEIETADGVKSSAIVSVNIKKNPVQDDKIQSSNEYLSLSELLSQAGTAAKTANDAADQAKQYADQAGEVPQELAGIRTGWNGKVYATAGEAVRQQIGAAVKSASISLTASSYADYFSDANEAPINTLVYISTSITSGMVSNLPEYGIAAGILRTEAWSAQSPTSGILQSFTTLNHAYFRLKTASGWQPWTPIFKREYFQSANASVTPNSYTDYFTDANNAPSNRVYYLSALLTPEMVANLPEYGAVGFLSTLTWNPDSNNARVQMYATSGRLYSRVRLTDGSWSSWADLLSEARNTTARINARAYQVLKRVGVCGDSLSVGYIYNKETQTASRRNEIYSWPHNLGAEYGGEYLLLGHSGYDCTKFLNGEEGYGLPYAQKPENKCPVYILCLGYNDASDTAPEVGSSADIGTDANTFYGLYSKIISELQAINPGCIVICMNFADPANVGKRVEIQQAIEYIATSASLPNVCLCDLSKYEVYYTGESAIQDNILSGVHYTAVGYQLMVEPIKMALSDTINANQEMFSQINFIQ